MKSFGIAWSEGARNDRLSDPDPTQERSGWQPK
jgi:hypothetical protein